MGNTLTKDQLIEKRVELESEVTAAQENTAARLFEVDFENVQNLNAVLKQIDKAYSWNIKNAALVVNLYDALKSEKTAIQKTEDTATIELNSLQLNTLYQVLTNIEGTGVETARTFIRLLTNVGKQITDAMAALAEANKEVQSLHVALAEIDAAIEEQSKETVEADEIS